MHRNSFHKLLYLSWLLSLGLLVASERGEAGTSERTQASQSKATDTPSSNLPPQQQRAHDIFKQLIEINTTHSTGDTTLASQAMADRLLAAGFPAADVQVLGPVERKGNLVARYRGKDAGLKPLLLLAHLDVVEADPADWTLEPFTFTEQDGYYYGRGTSDDKAMAAIFMANFLQMKEAGFQPERDIILALTADEEGGDHNGVKWLLANHPDLIDAEFALNEGGDGELKNGKRIANTVQASEKVYQTFTLEVTNPGGHSSVPRKENAIYRLSEALLRIANFAFPVSLNDVTKLFFERSAKLEQDDLAEAMRGVLQSPPDPAAITLLADMPLYNAMLRTTCVATRLDAGHADNALPQRARATVNCRVLPGTSIDSVQNTLATVIGDNQVAISRVGKATASPPSPLTPELLHTITSISEELWPGVPVIPVMSTGATDGLYLRNAGIPVYGASGIFDDIDDIRAHGQNERILIEAFYDGQKFLYKLTEALSHENLK